MSPGCHPKLCCRRLECNQGQLFMSKIRGLSKRHRLTVLRRKILQSLSEKTIRPQGQLVQVLWSSHKTTTKRKSMKKTTWKTELSIQNRKKKSSSLPRLLSKTQCLKLRLSWKSLWSTTSFLNSSNSLKYIYVRK